jgi:hypothetical protein
VLDVVFSSGLLRLIGVFLMALLGDLEAGKRGVAWRLPEEFGRCVACQMAEGSRVDRWHWRGGCFVAFCGGCVLVLLRIGPAVAGAIIRRVSTRGDGRADEGW